LVIVDVTQGSRADHWAPIKLASFSFALNEIEKQCSNDGQWTSIVNTLENVGQIEIEARRLSCDAKYIHGKKKEVITALDKLIDKIKEFNASPRFHLDARLTGNVKGIGGLSLLHAAVELFDCESLVEKLLELQADPTAPSQSHGTPIDIANRHYQRSREKESCQRGQRASSHVIDKYVEVSKKAKRMLDLLNSASGTSE
jgi:hypothetical protein